MQPGFWSFKFIILKPLAVTTGHYCKIFFTNHVNIILLVSSTCVCAIFTLKYCALDFLPKLNENLGQVVEMGERRRE